MLVSIMPGGDTAVEGEGRLDGCGLQEVNALGENGRRKRWSLSVVPARAGMTPTAPMFHARHRGGPHADGGDSVDGVFTTLSKRGPSECGDNRARELFGAARDAWSLRTRW